MTSSLNHKKNLVYRDRTSIRFSLRHHADVRIIRPQNENYY